jgi:hypothetical protein
MIDESFFPHELRSELQGSETGMHHIHYRSNLATTKRHTKKYNLDDFLEVSNEDDIPEQIDDESKGPNRTDIIRNEDDDDLEPPAPDPDADEDLDEDDYGR